MSKRTISFWAVEFLAVTAIAILLSTSTVAAKRWVTLPVVIIIGAKIAEYRENVHARLNSIRYQLEILLTLLPSEGARIRCTYHCPVHRIFKGARLAQVFDYIPNGGGGGRRFPIEKGIIGAVYRLKGPRVENFASDEEYRTRMVSEYDYTVSEVMQRTVDRRSYACYPIVDEKHEVLGLLYFDSDRVNTFTMEQVNPRWQAICAAGDVIRGHVLAGL